MHFWLRTWTYSSGAGSRRARHRRRWQPQRSRLPSLDLAGSRRTSHGSPLTPPPKPVVFAMVGAVHWSQQLGQGRPPSRCRGDRDADRLIGGAGVHHTASLGFVGVPLQSSRSAASKRLRRRSASLAHPLWRASQRAQRPPAQGLWNFSGPIFCNHFQELLKGVEGG